MLSRDRLRALALGTALLAVGNLGFVTYRLFTFDFPDTSGEDIAGLFFAIAIVLAVVALVDAVFAGVLLWAAELSSRARGLTGGGLAAATVTGLGVTAYQLDLLVGIGGFAIGLVRELFFVGVGGGLAVGLAALVTLIERFRDGSTT